MEPTRRSVIAALFAPLLAKLLPKPKFDSGVAIAHTWKEGGHIFYNLNFPTPNVSWYYDEKIHVVEFWPRINDKIMFVESNKDMEFLTGKSWDVRSADWQPARQCKPIDRMTPEITRIMNPDGSVKFTNIA